MAQCSHPSVRHGYSALTCRDNAMMGMWTKFHHSVRQQAWLDCSVHKSKNRDPQEPVYPLYVQYKYVILLIKCEMAIYKVEIYEKGTHVLWWHNESILVSVMDTQLRPIEIWLWWGIEQSSSISVRNGYGLTKVSTKIKIDKVDWCKINKSTRMTYHYDGCALTHVADSHSWCCR